ncbi:MAG: AbrB/MazE/SpoVT family DNA-binding domain-containing protein [bacterium]|nr:AbrB/MazE/SpoVT family DNA-binding domain-containing protein [bacterium]
MQVFSTVSSKGQVTLPGKVRHHLGVKGGSRVAFLIKPGGEVKVIAARYPNIQSLKGAAGSLKHKLSLKEMKRIAYEDRFKLNKYAPQ